MTTIKSNTEQLMKWFLLCPLFDKNNAFLIDNLGADATEYALFSVPTEVKHSGYLSGKAINPIQPLDFVLAVRMPYGLETPQNLKNLEFFSELEKWVYARNQLKLFPIISEGTVKSISINTTPTIVDAAPHSARYQVKGTLTTRSFT